MPGARGTAGLSRAPQLLAAAAWPHAAQRLSDAAREKLEGGLPAPALRMRGPRRPRHLLRAGPQASTPPQARAVTPLGGRRGVVLTPSPISRLRSGQVAGGRPRGEVPAVAAAWASGWEGGPRTASPRRHQSDCRFCPPPACEALSGRGWRDRLPAPEPRSTPGHT